jgi:hypothetical protein
MALKLMATLGLDGSGFESGLHKAEHASHEFVSSLKGIVIGAVGIGTLEMAMEKTVETARELIETSERLAIAPEQLQIMRKAAKDSGMEFENLVSIIEKLNVARQKAIGGDFSSLAAFKALGVSQSDVKGTKSTQDLLMGPIANAVKNINPAQIGEAFREVGVKGFGQLIPFLKKDFDDLGDSMKKTGQIMDTETALKLKKFGDSMSTIAQLVTAHLGPALVKVAEVLYTTVLKVGGAIAGFMAKLGGGTGKWSWKDFGFAFVDPLNITRNRQGFDSAAADAAQAAAEKPYADKLSQFQEALKRIAEEADTLNHPTAADNTREIVAKKLDKRALETPADSLVKIGNFFGDSKNSIASIAQEQLNTMKKIEKNTRNAPSQPGRCDPSWADGMMPQFPVV